MSERGGLSRFEVLGREVDRALIRSLARRLAEEGPESVRLHAALHQRLSNESPGKRTILDALRRSPMVGAELDLAQSREAGRKVEL